MIRKRKAGERGHADFGWLDTHHSFSFGNYFDRRHMNFRALRVLNDDRIAPGGGFPPHPHRDMEILSFVVEGALEHRDSTGSGAVAFAGDVQRMSAGRGITHSEFNHSPDEPLRILQVWIEPERAGLEPSYEQKSFDEAGRRRRLRPIASRTGRDGSLTIHQDVGVYASRLERGETVEHAIAPGRHAWLQVVSGDVRLDSGENTLGLGEGDGAAISEEAALRLAGAGDDAADVLLFDLA